MAAVAESMLPAIFVHVDAVQVIQHADQPDLAAVVLVDAVPGVGGAGEFRLRGDDVLAAAGLRPPGHLAKGAR
jgi:hypothetical protein